VAVRGLFNRGWRAAAMRAAIATPCAALVLTLTGSPAHGSGPTVTGAGSTWVQIALDQWRADIARQGYSINYQGVGSSAGRNFYLINQVDFAASEIPFQPDEVVQLQAAHKSYQYLPDVAGGTSLMYNLHSGGARITSLRMDAPTAARIFTGAITTWQDHAIQALNPGLLITETTITPVIRSDGSGTSAQFSLYLASQASAQWNAFVSSNGCPAPCSQWPVFAGSTQQNGSDGVANFIASDALGAGAIGYVEAGYAYGRNFPVANLKNVSGHFVQPKSDNVATALTHALLHSDETQDLGGVYNAPEANAYPMSSYSYMITPTANFDPAKGNVLGTWLIYIACAGQREAAPLGYSPLPPNLVQVVFDAVKRIPGAPAPPPIDRDHCPNPTVTNAAAGGGGTQPPSSGGGGGGGATPSGGGRGPASGGGASGSRNSGAAASTSNGAASTAGSPGGAAGQGDSTATGGTATASGVPNTGGGAKSGGATATPRSARLVTTLSDDEKQARLADALLTTSKVSDDSMPPAPLIAVVALLAIVFTPMLASLQNPSRDEDR
jgi:phosphate transport system substrate-binding protein